jgi:hypothetical protein
MVNLRRAGERQPRPWARQRCPYDSPPNPPINYGSPASCPVQHGQKPVLLIKLESEGGVVGAVDLSSLPQSYLVPSLIF